MLCSVCINLFITKTCKSGLLLLWRAELASLIEKRESAREADLIGSFVCTEGRCGGGAR